LVGGAGGGGGGLPCCAFTALASTIKASDKPAISLNFIFSLVIVKKRKYNTKFTIVAAK
jgi:hypothetical protein